MQSVTEVLAHFQRSGNPRFVYITITEIKALVPIEKCDNMIIEILEMPGVRVTNSYEGGILIPTKYFEE